MKPYDRKLIPYGKEPYGFWRQIPGYDGYEASMDGQIRKRYPEGYRILSTYKKSNGIYVVKLDGRERSAHRAVYTAFYGAVPKDKIVIHKDGVYSNHAPYNLAVADKSVIGRIAQRANGKRVLKYDPETLECVGTYLSARECAKANHFCRQIISDRCNGVTMYASSSDGYEYCWEDDPASYRKMVERIKKGRGR